ncbi:MULTISPECIES: YcgL domain-containing protein [Pseudoalteromonas]|uniref:YcgL domain-containing protein n=1 Tax=Pseudoalteromonas TaxID=53246 RepID=UPI0015CDE6C8|nr:MULTISPECIES: YcgL domain-containing protein [Pseudoalteromonas]MBB1370491.1 YcgL domain-containing protein [Pseudoalteromonas sp. SR45-4]MBO7925129.1 YcgL domain-containing protein [Pseudoalteromonas sp. K222D]NYR11259.1 YcgL domain-containing protein [Pseudoalteromonas sp. MIP2626]WMS96394.1 YcgL domain-containing protein [Pseudoalteromonas sp. HL-AS2]|tara:strand:+ start:2119 stop:2400 length:282 start_codon:yes stop_codon:yes gene_type:complete
MLTAVYKSKKKADSFLFVEKRDDFTKVPEPLMAMFGQPKYVMLINLAKREVLGTADLETVKAALTEKGYYLQIPPPQENLLSQLRKENGAEND